ncbi:MAG: selenocysteine synthase [Alphaproteobacteria bacterium]|nr:selenocysteine synthase [Alphaproteobacteria bacterium]
MSADRFGNKIDPSVGFARGRFLTDSAAEIRRMRHGQAVAARHDPERIAIFTGNPRYFPLKSEDLTLWCEEWVGPGHFAERLLEAAIGHFGGGDTAAVVNRTSAGIVATALAHAGGSPIVSLVPEGDRSHASLVRGAALARAPLVEVSSLDALRVALTKHAPKLLAITSVTSTLARIEDELIRAGIAAGKAAGATVFLDEAYGARLRPVLHGGAKSLTMGADFAITNADKAGLSGPRAGVLCGTEAPVIATLAKASELGQEARAPIAAGAMRSLENFNPQDLLDEARDGQSIADILEARWGANVVERSDLGPMVGEEDVLSRVLASANRNGADLAPAEASALVGMLMLGHHGALTVNTHGAPGGRVSLRLKPVAGALARVGGAEALADGLDAAIASVGRRLDDDAWIAATLFGEG